MKTNLLLAGAAALSMIPSAAWAQDVPADEPFSGVYVGGTIGFDAQPNDFGETIEFDRNLDGTFRDSVLTPTGGNAFVPGFCPGPARGNSVGAGCNSDHDDIGYAGRIGWDQQYGKIAVGVVGEFGKSEISDSVTAFSSTPASYTFTREVNWEASIRGRAGYVAGRSTLFYGTFGVGYANIDNTFTTTNTANTFPDTGNDKQWGILGGGGVEQKLTDNISIGLEYMFHRYEDTDYRVRATAAGVTPFTNPANGGTAAGTDFRRNFDYFRWHSIRATAAFRF